MAKDVTSYSGMRGGTSEEVVALVAEAVPHFVARENLPVQAMSRS